MYSFTDLQREIGAKIEWLRDNNGPTLHPDWITQAIIGDHSRIQGADADFYTCCSRSSIRKEVREQINKLEAPDSTSNKQLTLDGFEHLHQYYVVSRDKEQVAVRIDHLTDAELDAKANEYEAMGHSLLKHSRELLRYKDLRRSELRVAHFGNALHLEARQ
jgi:hypothetical protein